MNSKDQDLANLLTSLHLAIDTAISATRSGETFEAVFAKANHSATGQCWQITVARKLHPSWSDWLARPWHCWMLRNLVRKLLTENLSPKDEAAALRLLTRCASLIEYGAEVNSAWYRLLRMAVIEKRVTSVELRSLLKSSTVWWGTHDNAPPAIAPLRNPMQFLWQMGRPSNGDLFIIPHRWPLKLLLLLLLCLAGYGLVRIGFGVQQNWVKRGSACNYILLLLVAFQISAVLWITWFVGPRSWWAAQKLVKLFPELRQRPHALNNSTPGAC